MTEADCVFDFETFFDGCRNPGLAGLWGKQRAAQNEKPHVFEVGFDLHGNVRVPKVRSFVAASGQVPEKQVRDWAPVFLPGKLPQPSHVPIFDFHSSFEASRVEMVRILRNSQPGSLGLSERQMSDYEKLTLPKAHVEPLPFKVAVLPACAQLAEIDRGPVDKPVAKRRRRPSSKKSAPARTVRARARKKAGDDNSDEADADLELPEEEEEEDEQLEDDDDEEDEKEIVALVKLGGNARVTVQYSDGSKQLVSLDALPEQWVTKYHEMLSEKQAANVAAHKKSLAEHWHQVPGRRGRN